MGRPKKNSKEGNSPDKSKKSTFPVLKSKSAGESVQSGKKNERSKKAPKKLELQFRPRTRSSTTSTLSPSSSEESLPVKIVKSKVSNEKNNKVKVALPIQIQSMTKPYMTELGTNQSRNFNLKNSKEGSVTPKDSALLKTFRIPKVKGSKQTDSTDSSPVQTTNTISQPLPLRSPINTSNRLLPEANMTSTRPYTRMPGSLLNDQKPKFNKNNNNTKTGSPHTINNASISSCSNKPKILQAKRRLSLNSDASHKMPETQSATTSKIRNGLPTTNHQSKRQLSSQTVKKMYPDLPDYEEGFEGYESMEWENPLPQILKMVKESSKGSEQVPLNMEEDGMEVDQDPSEQLIIVPDTNIWIGELDLLKRLLNTEFPRVSFPTIVIPWMVLQELDVNIHKSSRWNKARLPVEFIHSLLSKKHPRVKGQKASEAAISKLKFDELVADDSILNCVFQMQKSNNIVIFLTNDKNLLNKALVHGVLSCDSKSVIEKINNTINEDSLEDSVIPRLVPEHDLSFPKNLSVNSSSSFTSGTKRKSEFNSLKSSIQNLPSYSLIEIDMEDDPMLGSDRPPLSKIPATGQPFSSNGPEPNKHFQALLKAFAHIIQRKMVEDYGMGGWEFALKIKPPWTLKTAIKCILAHWIANFSFVFTPKGKIHAENFEQLILQYETLPTSNRNEVERNIVEAALSLFNLGDKSMMNEDVVLSCRKVLMDYTISKGI